MLVTHDEPKPTPVRTVIALGNTELTQAIIDFAVKEGVEVPTYDRWSLTWIEDDKDDRQILLSIEQDTEITRRI